jgi:beta-glucosidase
MFGLVFARRRKAVGARFALPGSAAALLVAASMTVSTSAPAAAPVEPGGAQVRVSPRVLALLSQMTVDEKLSLLSGVEEDQATREYVAGYLPGVARLGIPSLRLADGPPGVASRRLSTGMTQTMGVAATFSTADAGLNGVVIGRDARALGQDVVLEPFVNLLRDPTWRRAFNTFGEDPLLAGELGAATIRGIQSQGVMAQVKHYVAYDGATGDVKVDEQTLRELYVKPFEDAVAAGVSSVMCSYNKVNGVYACGNAHTLKDILKGQLGFQGFVTSDWGANHAVDFINQGLDMEMPGTGLGGAIPQIWSPANLKAAISAGTVSLATVDEAVGRILGQYERFGLLDGRSKHDVTEEPVEDNAHVVQRTAEHAATLLKNDDGALPLGRDDLQDLAMIGPGAGQTMATGGGGEKSVGRADRWIGTVEALRSTVPGAQIDYAVADDMTGTPVPASALSHDGAPGLLRTTAGSSSTQVDAQLDLTVAGGNALPSGAEHTWTGTLTAPESGSYWINLGELGATGSVTIDGTAVISKQNFPGLGIRFGTIKAGENGVLPTTGGLNNVRAQVTLTAGAHTLAVGDRADVSGAPVQLQLNWVTPSQQTANRQAAVDAARRARTAVVFAWTTGSVEAPLPEGQDQLISDVVAANPNTIVVLNTHLPVAMPWLGDVKAVLNMWFPGDEGGWATANVLDGKANPAGRLPFTWPASLEQGVANDPAHPERSSAGVDPGTMTPCTSTASGPGNLPNCETRYTEGIDIGYRWFERNALTPQYPFGYGLSYTQFRYSRLSLRQGRHGRLRVSFRVRNVGDRPGDEVPQVYLGPPSNRPAGVQFAVKALAAFDRVTLWPHESRRITLDVAPRELSYWDTAHSAWTVATGERTVFVGRSERDVALQSTASIRPTGVHHDHNTNGNGGD